MSCPLAVEVPVVSGFFVGSGFGVVVTCSEVARLSWSLSESATYGQNSGASLPLFSIACAHSALCASLVARQALRSASSSLLVVFLLAVVVVIELAVVVAVDCADATSNEPATIAVAAPVTSVIATAWRASINPSKIFESISVRLLFPPGHSHPPLALAPRNDRVRNGVLPRWSSPGRLVESPELGLELRLEVGVVEPDELLRPEACVAPHVTAVETLGEPCGEVAVLLSGLRRLRRGLDLRADLGVEVVRRHSRELVRGLARIAAQVARVDALLEEDLEVVRRGILHRDHGRLRLRRRLGRLRRLRRRGRIEERDDLRAERFERKIARDRRLETFRAVGIARLEAQPKELLVIGLRVVADRLGVG